MKGFLVAVGKEASASAINVLNQYGQVGMISPELFAVRSSDSIDTMKSNIKKAFPDLSYVLVAEVSE